MLTNVGAGGAAAAAAAAAPAAGGAAPEAAADKKEEEKKKEEGMSHFLLGPILSIENYANDMSFLQLQRSPTRTWASVFSTKRFFLAAVYDAPVTFPLPRFLFFFTLPSSYLLLYSIIREMNFSPPQTPRSREDHNIHSNVMDYGMAQKNTKDLLELF